MLNQNKKLSKKTIATLIAGVIMTLISYGAAAIFA